MKHPIAAGEIMALSALSMLAGACAVVCGCATLSGPPAVALWALAASAALFAAYAALTHRIIVQRPPVRDTEEATR